VLAAVLLGLTALHPAAVLSALVMLGLFIAFSQSALKLVAAAVSWRSARPPQAMASPAKGPFHLVTGDAALPHISLMVPLYRESRIVARLIRRLAALDYPRRALQVLLLTEDNDSATAAALASLDLPAWVQVLPVPSGTIRTKPRALNYGLDHCKGEIIGVYDAEDAPEADQLRKVAESFAKGGPELACLQGRLDYYNPHSNWLARCFTLEYATWWRVVLDGFARMGFAIPLGGTTLFFRRDILVGLGGWDAHNVTEDAELGLRLARRGYHTQLIDSTTFEEANCRALPWVKQRSRWIKGYMMTYAALMRTPLALWRELGAWRFFGMQMMMAGSVLHALMLPVQVLLWPVALGLLDPGNVGLAAGLLAPISGVGILAEVLGMLVIYLGMRRAGHRIHPIWIATMQVYGLLAGFAAYKALAEVLTKPFYWDKTAHGVFDR